MGLDQYLKARRYVGGYEHSKSEEKDLFNALLVAAKIDQTLIAPGSPHLYLEVSVAYWRKANQIHAWFVRECQDGEDDCRDAYVSRAQLEQLRDLCNKVIAKTKLVPSLLHRGDRSTGGGPYEPIMEEGLAIENPQVADELLPTTQGFFFGGTEYDEYYIDDLKRTVEQISNALMLPDCWYFQYQSSW